MEISDPNCFLYGQQTMKTRHHLFVERRWIKEVREELLVWTNTQFQQGTMKRMLLEIQKKHCKLYQKEVTAAVCGAMLCGETGRFFKIGLVRLQMLLDR